MYLFVKLLFMLYWTLAVLVMPGAFLGWLILQIGERIYRRRP